eukprot:13841811-Ditylum_brightwellii.AAC.1
MAIEETTFEEPTPTGLVDDNPTNEADDSIVTWNDVFNGFSYGPSSKRYTMNKRLLNKKFQAVKGPVNNGQYRLVDLKATKLIEEACTKYVWTKFEGLAGKDSRYPLLALSVYKDIIRKHFIKNGMWDVFQFQLPKSKKMICMIENMDK